MKTILKLLPLIIGLAISGVIAYFGESWAGDNRDFEAWLTLIMAVSLVVGTALTINNFFK